MPRFLLHPLGFGSSELLVQNLDLGRDYVLLLIGADYIVLALILDKFLRGSTLLRKPGRKRAERADASQRERMLSSMKSSIKVLTTCLSNVGSGPV